MSKIRSFLFGAGKKEVTYVVIIGRLEEYHQNCVCTKNMKVFVFDNVLFKIISKS